MWLQYAGSIASILGLAISLYVLWREYVIEKDVTELKHEEEAWHKEHTPPSGEERTQHDSEMATGIWSSVGMGK